MTDLSWTVLYMQAKKWLEQNQLTGQAAQRDRVPSTFGIEVSVVNSLAILEQTVELIKGYGINCQRFNETRGAIFHLCEWLK